MNDIASVSRRMFVQLAGLLVLAGPIARRDGLLRRLVGEVSPRAAAAWREVIPAPRSAHVLGQRYLAVATEERDASVLMRRLGTAIPAPYGHSDDSVTRISSDHLRELLRNSVRKDFEHEDTVQIDGWVLARTECRLCALAVMLG